MIIHQLEIQNFKSYNGSHVLGPFDAHFNCVIGPNGNGKSNIIDAVLFVFGFKSAKLRQDSLASLIHRSAFAKPEHATVTVVFKEDK
jgi:structural maintenance of chromosome 4